MSDGLSKNRPYVFSIQLRLVSLVCALVFLAIPIAAYSGTDLIPVESSERTLTHSFDKAITTRELTPYWSQEYVGADLIDEAMANVPLLQNPVPVALVDEQINPRLVLGRLSPGFKTAGKAARGDHGTAVANILNGKAPFGVGKYAEIVAVGFSSQSFSYAQISLMIRASQARLVNISMQMTDSPMIDRDLSLMAANAILVISASNYWPGNIDGVKLRVPAILVGSLAPDGLPTDSSQEAEAVTISAPADYWQRTVSEVGVHSFGLTSGATPMVTGALSNVLAILPGMSLQEAKTLLCRTALPTLNAFQNPSRSGCGALNALKLT